MEKRNSVSLGGDEVRQPGLDLSSVMPELEKAFAEITRVVVGVLEERLRAEIDSRIQAVTNEAAQTIHARIAMAMGQIQPVAIPINLLVQPSMPWKEVAQMPAVLPVHSSVDVQPVHVSVKETSLASNAPEAPVIQAQPVPPVASPVEVDLASKHMPTEALPGVSVLVPASVSPVAVVAKKKGLKITVVGLKPGQAHMIKSEFKFIQLSFVQANSGNSSQLTALSKSNDRVIFMTDFISHKSVDVVRAAHGAFLYISGGMTVLREKLQELMREYLGAGRNLAASL
jgi:hypothetical protein